MGLHGLNCTEGEDNGTESSAVGERVEKEPENSSFNPAQPQ